MSTFRAIFKLISSKKTLEATAKYQFIHKKLQFNSFFVGHSVRYCSSTSTSCTKNQLLSNIPTNKDRKRVEIVEVSPRDGLQNLDSSNIVPVDVKLELIKRLRDSGLKKIECGSFVSDRWVPQMANSAQVFKDLLLTSQLSEIFDFDEQQQPHSDNIVCALNQKGFERAIEAGCQNVCYVLSASEYFSEKNMNCSIKQSLERLESCLKMNHGMKMHVTIACSFGCRYEPITAAGVMNLFDRLCSYNAFENIVFADTIGSATPANTYNLMDALLANKNYQDGKMQVGVHYHNTYNLALSNILVCLHMLDQLIIESSVAGLGGCPFAGNTTGNVATEDVVYLLDSLGIDHGVDMQSLTQTSNYICNELHLKCESKTAVALNKRSTNTKMK